MLLYYLQFLGQHTFVDFPHFASYVFVYCASISFSIDCSFVSLVNGYIHLSSNSSLITSVYNYTPCCVLFFVCVRNYHVVSMHSKKCWVISTQIWVKSNMDKPKCWFKNVKKKKNCTVESESWVKILNYIFNPTFGFVHILPNFGLKQPSIV